MRSPRIRWVLIALAVVAILGVIALLPVTMPTADTTDIPAPPSAANGGENVSDLVGPIDGGKVAIQTFPATGARIRSVALLIGTYQRTNHGTARVTVQASIAGEWRELAAQTIAKETLQDTMYYVISFSSPLRVSPGQPLRILLEADGGPGDAIAWRANTRWDPSGYMLTFDGKEQEGTARIRVSYAPASGHLFRMLGPVRERLTVFLNPFWQFVLILGFGLLIGSIVLLCRHSLE